LKIALAMYGIPRASDITLPVIHDCFIKPAEAMGDCRVFYHLYLQKQVVNARSGENTALSEASYLPFEKFDGELEAPDLCLAQWHFDTIQLAGDHYNDDFRSIRNLVHQLHSMRQVTKRMADWQPDIVMFLRPDLLYQRGFANAELHSVAKNQRQCILPAWQWWGGYNDRFSLCGKEAFQAYGNRIELVNQFSKETGRPLQAERLVRFALQKAKASIRVTSLKASRVRADGQIKAENFSAVSTAGSLRRNLELNWLRALTQLSI
jgi:hypothetical protein